MPDLLGEAEGTQVMRGLVFIVIAITCAILIYAQLTMPVPANNVNCAEFGDHMARAACIAQKEGKP